MNRPSLSTLLLLSALIGAAAAAEPPPTPREPVEETLHGEALSDPYRWLEGDAKGELTDRVAEWTDWRDAFKTAMHKKTGCIKVAFSFPTHELAARAIAG